MISLYTEMGMSGLMAFLGAGGLQLQVVSPAQFEAGGKSQTAGLEEIMR